MGKRKNKRGLMAPQPAAQITALDFARASEGFDQALAVYRAASQDDNQEAFAAAICVVDATAEALCAIPTRDRASIAKKIAAAAWLSEDDAFDFADPSVVRRVAQAGPEERHTKALLAIFPDLAAPEVDPNADLLADVDADLALEGAVQAGDPAVEREWDGRCMAAIKACDALPASRANVPAKLAGLRLIFDNNGDLGALERKSTDDRLLADIALRPVVMNGAIDPGASAPTFDAAGFLREFEAVGGRVVTNGQSFAVIYPSDADIIPTVAIDWGAVVAEASNRARMTLTDWPGRLLRPLTAQSRAAGPIILSSERQTGGSSGRKSSGCFQSRAMVAAVV